MFVFSVRYKKKCIGNGCSTQFLRDDPSSKMFSFECMFSYIYSRLSKPSMESEIHILKRQLSETTQPRFVILRFFELTHWTVNLNRVCSY